MRSPGYFWLQARRAMKRGLPACWAEYVTSRRIADWKPPANASQASCPLHTASGHELIGLTAWMLASFHHYTERIWPIVLHDDGTLADEDREFIMRLFPDINIIERERADREMKEVLANFSACQAYRTEHPLALKIFDVPHFARKEAFLFIDADVLFFQKPERILQWVDEREDACWFNKDAMEASNVSRAEASNRWGVDLWPRVNSGLNLLRKKALDLDFCEDILTHSSIRSGHIWRVEQTLFALCASRYAHGGLLPSSYEVSLGRSMAEDCVARHYIGSVRERFWAEGVSRLNRILFS